MSADYGERDKNKNGCIHRGLPLMSKLHLFASGIVLTALVGCTTRFNQPQSLDKHQIQSLAESRCLVETGLFDRAGAGKLAKIKLENARDDAWKSHWSGVLDAQRNGLSAEDYKSLTLSSAMKDCHNTAITWLAIEFPSKQAARFMAVLMAEGFLDDPPKKLNQTLFELCQVQYKSVCTEPGD